MIVCITPLPKVPRDPEFYSYHCLGRVPGDILIIKIGNHTRATITNTTCTPIEISQYWSAIIQFAILLINAPLILRRLTHTTNASTSTNRSIKRNAIVFKVSNIFIYSSFLYKNSSPTRPWFLPSAGRGYR